MAIKLKGGKLKLEGSGSSESANTSMADREAAETVSGKKAVVVSIPGGASLMGVAFEMELPDGSKQKGKIDGSGSMNAQVDPSGSSKLSFTGLNDALKGSS